MKDLIYLHGFASDSNGYKVNILKTKLSSYSEISFHSPNFNATLADFQHKTITGMIARLRQYILSNRLIEAYIIASSLSGIVALHYAKRYGNIAGMLLLAPMTRYFQIHSQQEEELWAKQTEINIDTSFAKNALLSYNFVLNAQSFKSTVSPPKNTSIIHGIFDETVPIQRSRNYSSKYGINLIEQSADHSLADEATMLRIWQEVKNLLELN